MKKAVIFLMGGTLISYPSVLKAQNLRAKKTVQDIESIQIQGKMNKEVVSIPRKTLDVIQSNTLGETLSKIPGIQNSGYGPNSGAPVIRSLSGNRVRILENGTAVNDLSGISPDFNLDIQMDNVQNISIYKNSAAVLYGGKAIGGAVDIETNYIVRQLPSKKINLQALLEGGSNSGQKQSFSAKGTITKNWIWTMGGSNQKQEIVRIPGKSKDSRCYDPNLVGFNSILQSLCQLDVNSRNVLNISLFPYISQFAKDHMVEYELSQDDLYTFSPTYYNPSDGQYYPNPKNDQYVPGQDPTKDRYRSEVNSIKDYVPTKDGVIPNSHSESNSFYVGTSYIGKSFYLGGAYQNAYSYFGVPGYTLSKIPKHSHGKPQKTLEYVPINIKSLSHKAMLETAYQFNHSPIAGIKFNYMGVFSSNSELLERHKANQFHVQQHNGRLEIAQQKLKFLTGTTGVEVQYREMEGSGSQRYLPDNISREIGIFTMQHLKFDFLEFDLGYRNDHVQRRADADKKYIRSRGLSGGNLMGRDFTLNQFHTAAQWNILKKAYLKVQYNHSERAPEVNELYAGNNHFAILTEENGDDKLDKEIAKTWEIGGGLNLKNIRLSANWYHTFYKNYIYLAHTGISREVFLVKEWRSDDTEINGIEAEAAYKMDLHTLGKWEVGSYYDLVRNISTADSSIRKWSDGDYMPNMPTSRFGFNLSGTVQKLNFNIALDHYMKQKYLGKNINPELPMPAFSLLNARVSYEDTHLKMGSIEYYIAGSNLLNTEARLQNSQLKFLSPLAGINISVGVKIKIS
ncbi:iron complex outermembrane receptor protein [Chryseobacterium rhizosphaerae]|uniref:Iron complex outermembrane receptor protein n=1 Tax=Chryseobacterium rhizosphaerae TaxID=395937 RepID=A0AAE3Y6N9_9FLAO|nr:TonB-dependent receptor [Chryseobacterium rhizosphaerae]MDR6524994.1 iron complex outermembrane receptor protein [Chryseobacterium rhizosphaerae]MDR6525027.1 iron complex outermembrane receptor protein [Chryseobacterium rhizosphaerae]